MSHVVPTLEQMKAIYAKSTAGGADSERFVAYVELNRSGVPVSHYNPMTSRPETLETIHRLIEIEAEAAVERIASQSRFSSLPPTAVSVLTPGAWTDRLFTEVRARREGIGGVWFWSGEKPDESAVERRTLAEFIRSEWRHRHGPIETLGDYAAVEALAAQAPTTVESDSIDRVSDVLEVLGGAQDDETLIAFTFGDEVASANGWTALGLRDNEGIAVSAAMVPADRDVFELIAERWSPFTRGGEGGWLPASPSE